MISVCIPTFEQYGHGVKYLAQLLDTTVPQQGEFEVIISDNSQDDAIKALVDGYKSKLNIRYYRNPILGISHNTNHAILQAKSNKIKLMYMDDKFVTTNALEIFDKALDSHSWVCSNSIIINDHSQRIAAKRAFYSHRILEGYNTIGMPSVIAFRKSPIEFDPQLKTLLDCEFYYLLHKEYGEPGYIHPSIIAQRYHDNSTSRKQINMKDREWLYLKEKHGL